MPARHAIRRVARFGTLVAPDAGRLGKITTPRVKEAHAEASKARPHRAVPRCTRASQQPELAVRFLLSLVAVVLTFPAFATSLTPAEDTVVAGLMSWAVKLSSYPAPRTMPIVEFVPQRFFDEQACNHRHCKVWGWYPNTGKRVVYVLQDARPLLTDDSDPRSLLAASIIVHEFVHYLQAASRDFAPYGCEQALALEREAYQMQTAYLVSYGRYLPVGISMHGSRCTGSASEHAHDPPPFAAAPAESPGTRPRAAEAAPGD